MFRALSVVESFSWTRAAGGFKDIHLKKSRAAHLTGFREARGRTGKVGLLSAD